MNKLLNIIILILIIYNFSNCKEKINTENHLDSNYLELNGIWESRCYFDSILIKKNFKMLY